MPQFDLIATSTFGLENVVARELTGLGYQDVRTSDGRVDFRGDERDIARCNLWLRSADRLLIRAGEFPAPGFEALFDQTLELPWHEWLPVDAKIPVNARCVRSQLHAVPKVQGAVKKAIIESLKRRYNRFRFDETGAEFAVEVSILRDVATITIDTSGDGLHKRGYREISNAAPLRETMAAGLIQLSYWNRERLLVDPFCGSGTIPIEAALIGRQIAPGLGRSFVAEDWPWMSRDLWKEVRAEAKAQRLPRLSEPILAFDHDPAAIRISERSATEAGVLGDIRLRVQEISDFRSTRTFGCVICNPPYGERLGETDEVEAVYREMGRVLSELNTWSIYVLTSNRYFEKHFGRKAARRRKLYNGRLECQYYQYPGPRPPGDASPEPEIPELPATHVDDTRVEHRRSRPEGRRSDSGVKAEGRSQQRERTPGERDQRRNRRDAQREEGSRPRGSGRSQDQRPTGRPGRSPQPDARPERTRERDSRNPGADDTSGGENRNRPTGNPWPAAWPGRKRRPRDEQSG